MLLKIINKKCSGRAPQCLNLVFVIILQLTSSKEEVDILMKLNHKHVVKCFCHFCTPGSLNSDLGAIVMELCKGSLNDLTSCKTLRDYELSRLMKQILEGIDHVHERGIIHR